MKKIIKLLSIISLTTTSSLSVISCSKKEIEMPKLTLAQKKTDIVNAINLKNTKDKDLNVKIDDIKMVPTPTFDGKNLSYNITIKQDSKSFLNNNFTYRIPEVSGNFDILNNKITNKIFKINYLPGKYRNYISDNDNIIIGTTNDFTIILTASFWNQFYDRTIQDFQGGANAWFKSRELLNSNIILTNSQWQNILYKLKTSLIPKGYAGCMHIIRKPGSDFQISYTNLTIKDRTNMPIPENNPSLPLTAFEANDIEDGSIITKGNNFITLNKDILSELKDVYNSKLDNQNYGNKNWNVNTISALLANNNYCNTNLSYDTIAECIFNNWNINIVNNFLSKNYSRDFRDDNGDLITIPIKFLTLQYDKDNKYIKNNLNI